MVIRRCRWLVSWKKSSTSKYNIIILLYIMYYVCVLQIFSFFLWFDIHITKRPINPHAHIIVILYWRTVYFVLPIDPPAQPPLAIASRVSTRIYIFIIFTQNIILYNYYTGDNGVFCSVWTAAKRWCILNALESKNVRRVIKTRYVGRCADVSNQCTIIICIFVEIEKYSP